MYIQHIAQSVIKYDGETRRFFGPSHRHTLTLYVHNNDEIFKRNLGLFLSLNS
jgi:hypothetical protein